jgi:Fur family ferric uptake transcriptional regulator
MGRRVGAGSDVRAELGHDWQAALRDRGYRLTPQRQLVLEAVGSLGHATPEEIVTRVRETASGVNISTVYRTLELLEELGLVRHTHLGHGAPTYSVATTDDHVHLVCRDCGAVDEAPLELVQAAVDRLARDKGFTVDVGHFPVFGRCRACGEQASDAGALSSS